ncbi:MAG: hypothetical protein LQ340_001048 [Diploschistes diacapsis]|nr:MAG: hypothetical protein LQ340_001048 [Diploschistes diacapsis]
MKLTNHSAIPVYTISGSSTARPLPEWLARKRKRSLKRDPEYASRIELLQDFEFEEASQCIRVSDDGDWIHTHYLPHLSLSFARHTPSLNTTFQLLSTDYTKSVHLQSDRSVEFHTPQGCHYTMRLPRYGRDLIFDKRSTEVLVPSVGVNEKGNGEVFRLNLELGRFMRSYEINVGGNDTTSANGKALQGGAQIGSANCAAIAEESHNLLAVGTSMGTVEFWDPRTRNHAGLLHPPWQNDTFDGIQGVTALQFHRSGLTFGTGSSLGLTHIYDLRSPVPLLKKDQGYGFPIQDIIFLDATTESRSQSVDSKVLTSDRRIIKIWDSRSGDPWTSVEPAVDLHSVAWCKNSGMLLTANEGRQQHSFFIPQLGPAPRWCTFLDNLVEEMAEDPNDPNAFTKHGVGEVYDNYKFLTVPQLEALNLSHLIGTTSLLRPYMHGYFVAQRLYEEAKLIADPFIWEEQRAKRVKEKIENERESRIRGNKKVAAKVNRRLAEKLLDRQDRMERRRALRVLQIGGGEEKSEAEKLSVGHKPLAENGGLLNDPRFAKLFQDEEFAIDETSDAFKALNPSTVIQPNKNGEKGLTAVEKEMMDELPGSSDTNSEDEEDENRHNHIPSKATLSQDQPSTISYKKYKKRPLQPQMKVVSRVKGNSDRDRSFGSRAMKPKKEKAQFRSVVGEREITFAPEKKGKARTPVETTRSRHEGKGRRSASGNVFRRM